MKIKFLIFVLILSLIETFNIVTATDTKVVSVPTELSNIDSDKDGYSNFCESLHKSDPQDKESTPKENITINVPSDVPYIQEAINAAIDNDRIVVAQGKYQGNINFNGKSIALTSTDPLNSDVVANTIIEGTAKGSVVTIDNSTSVLKGFTITSPVRNEFLNGASSNLDCRGIYIKNASPTIENCTIIDNQTTESGGGIYISTANARPKITNCIITKNKDNSGGHESAQISGGAPVISQSWINGQGLVDNTTQINTTDEEPTEEPITSVSETTVIEPASADTDIIIVEATNEDSPIIFLSGSPTWYVDDDASDTGTGTSWDNAFKYLQDALNDTRILFGDEIHVAQGTYKPDQGSDTEIIIPGNRTATFQLINGVAIKGGYAGIGTPDPDERDIQTHQTILNGDIGILDNTSDNSYHIISAVDISDTIILDGFIITGGNANGSAPHNLGGGMYNLKSNPIITNCIFTENSAALGGAVFSGTITEENIVYIDSCQVLDQPNTTYILTRDLNGEEVTTIHIVADGITFDGQGHSIQNPSLEDAVIYSTANNVTIKNCVLTASSSKPSKMGSNGNGHGIQLSGNNCLIENNTVIDTFWGIRVSGDGTIIQNNVLEGNAKAIHLSGRSNNMIVKNNLLKNNNKHQGYGLTVWGGEYNQLINNKIYGSSFGVVLYDASHTLIKCGEIHDSRWYDIEIYPQPMVDITARGVDYDTLHNRGEAEFTEYSDDCNALDCIWEGDICEVSPIIEDPQPSLTFTNCFFYNNTAEDKGGGVYQNGGSLTVTDCIFTENSSDGDGGGMSIFENNSNATVTNCIFNGNSTSYYGGGMYSYGSAVVVSNCLFTGNSASYSGLSGYGGGMFTGGDIGGSLTMTNCTFTGNTADISGGAMDNYTQDCNITVTNSIFWSNNARTGNEIFNHGGGSPTYTYCDIQGGYTGEGNINADPLFVNANNPKGADGIFGTLDDGLRIFINSPCVDSANGDTAPLTDITGLERIDIANIQNTGTGTPDFADIGACESGHDFDSDGMPDEWEVFYGLNPTNPADADDDFDGDVLTNLQEYLNGTDPTNPDDTDNDGLTDGEEIYIYNTDPLNPDTDDDDMPDGWEVQYNLDPLDSIDATQDPDEDGLTNLEEYQQGTNPQNPNPVLIWEKIGLSSPVDVVVDNNRNVYVLESGASVVTIYDKDGTYQAQVVLGASNPMGIDLDDTGNLYIADTGYNRIMKMEAVDTGLFVFSLDTTFSDDGIAGTQGTGYNQFNQPWGIGVDGDGNIYVTDLGNNRIQKLDSTGEFVDRWGTLGTEDGQFYQPKGIFVDVVGNIQIADSGNNRIQEFTSSGSLLNVWQSTNLFYQPADLTLNNYYIYITDAGNNQVQKFDNYKEYITSLTNLNLNNPLGIAIDENLEQELIYIADTGNSRLIKAEIPIIPPDETWNETKEALGTGNIELALENFDEASKERYSQIFTAIEAQLPTIISNMQAIELIYIRGDTAKYRIIREESGQDITYYIYFNKDKNGKWKIRHF